MFGYSLVPSGELQRKDDKVADLKYMLERMESEMHYWRGRADDERERADRLSDALNQEHGLPEVTGTVLRERKAVVEEVKKTIEKHEEELSEMFSDSLDAQDDLNWIDPDLQEAARTWMATAAKARAEKRDKDATADSGVTS